VQVQPSASPEQPVRHPSPSFELSSQFSEPNLKPSPQIGVQIEGADKSPPEQVYLASIPLQFGKHPMTPKGDK